jgi:hypothetical protein
MTRKQLNDLIDEFYGSEEDDFEGGVFEENDNCAEWARSNVQDLFDAISKFLDEKG